MLMAEKSLAKAYSEVRKYSSDVGGNNKYNNNNNNNNNRIRESKGKVKQSHYMSGQALRVPGA
jgi:hypothetical protein